MAQGEQGRSRPLPGSMGTVVGRGGAVVTAVGLIENVVQLTRAIVLAWILTPRDFGLMGMALLATQAAEAMSHTGFYRALVQTRKEAHLYLDTVFVVSVLRGILLFGLSFVAAPWVALFFDNPDLTSILRVVGVVFCIQGLMNPAIFLRERELAFVQTHGPGVVGVVVDFVASIGLALHFNSVWGMVWGYLLGRTCHVSLSYLVRPYLPGRGFRLHQAREFYRYGRHIFRSVSLEYLIAQLDRIVVGRLMGTDALGIYSFASRIARFPVIGLQRIAFRLGFPVFSSIQDDPDRQRRGLVRAVGVLAAVAAPVSCGLWLMGPGLVSLILDERWAGVLPPFSILCWAGLPLTLYHLVGTFVGSVGRPEIAVRGSVVFLLAVGIPIYPAAIRWGLRGVAACVVGAAVVGLLVVLAQVMRLVSLRLSRVFRPVAAPILATAGMAAAVTALGAWDGTGGGKTRMALEIVTGVIAYFALLVPLDAAFQGGLTGSLRSLFSGRPENRAQ